MMTHPPQFKGLPLALVGHDVLQVGHLFPQLELDLQLLARRLELLLELFAHRVRRQSLPRVDDDNLLELVGVTYLSGEFCRVTIQ